MDVFVDVFGCRFGCLSGCQIFVDTISGGPCFDDVGCRVGCRLGCLCGCHVDRVFVICREVSAVGPPTEPQ